MTDTQGSQPKFRRKRNFFLTWYFLGIFGFCLIAISIIFWRNQESKNIIQQNLNTSYIARSYASEAQTEFQNIYNAMDRIGHREAVMSTFTLEEWKKNAQFIIGTFNGLSRIAYADQSYNILSTVPEIESDPLVNQYGSDLIPKPQEIFLWLPINDGNQLQGFILGVIDLKLFFASAFFDLQNDYMFQVTNKGEIVVNSENWIQPPDDRIINQTITFPNAGAFSLEASPSAALVRANSRQATNVLELSLALSLIALFSALFTQRYSSLSKISELRFRKTLEGMTEGCQIVGPDWRYLFVNDTAAAQFQISKEAMLGHSITECFPNIKSTGLFPLLQKCMQERVPQEYLMQFPFNDPKHWYQLSIVPAPDGIFILSSDVTMQKLAEVDLAKSKALLSETEKSGKIGGFEFFVDTMSQIWTEETYRILEIDLSNNEPSVPEGVDFISPAYQKMANLAIQRAIDFGEPFDQEWEVITKKGNQSWVHALGKANQVQGKTQSVSGSFQDITEQKKIEIQMKHQLNELQRWHEVMLDREDRIQELKQEINELCQRNGESPRYGKRLTSPGDF